MAMMISVHGQPGSYEAVVSLQEHCYGLAYIKKVKVP